MPAVSQTNQEAEEARGPTQVVGALSCSRVGDALLVGRTGAAWRTLSTIWYNLAVLLAREAVTLVRVAVGLVSACQYRGYHLQRKR
jgi:hypothetical protein